MVDESENHIEVEASEWIARLDAASGDKVLEEAFEQWLAENPLHFGAFARANAAWLTLDSLKRAPSYSKPIPPATFNRRRFLIAGGSIAAIAASGAGIMIWAPERITTPIGEIRRVPLADGTLVNVNTNTALNVSLADDLREMTVQRGEVWFEVAKDKTRPFVVRAGRIRVRAVGTAFSVRRRDYGADVLVTEGTVEAWSTDDSNHKTLINAGSKSFVSDEFGATKVVSAGVEIQRALAWRNGEIALGGETLAEAAEEFNRYNEQKLVIDPALASLRLNGWFRTNEPQNFAEATAKAIGADIVVVGNEIRFRSR